VTRPGTTRIPSDLRARVVVAFHRLAQERLGKFAVTGREVVQVALEWAFENYKENNP